MKGFKKWEEKGSSNDPFTHGGTGTSKCGIDTKFPLPLFSLWVPVPVRYRYQIVHASNSSLDIGANYSGTDTTLQKFQEFSTFWISLYARFLHCFKLPPN